MGVCHQGPPYLGAIGTSQALFCDGCIILNLGQKNGAQILDPGGLCKVQNGGQGQAGSVHAFLAGIVRLINRPPILGQPGDIGVSTADGDGCGVKIRD